jgi:hypothetical protein
MSITVVIKGMVRKFAIIVQVLITRVYRHASLKAGQVIVCINFRGDFLTAAWWWRFGEI